MTRIQSSARVMPMLAFLACGLGCNSFLAEPAQAVKFPSPTQDLSPPAANAAQQREIVLAGGCFWCTQAVFEQLGGVKSVVSGYAGGMATDAAYNKVAAGRTKHAEVIKVVYDPRKITYGRLLQVFFSVAHDPTQKDRQGSDVGAQYRSAIFYANEEQRRVAAAYIQQLEAAQVFDRPIVTTLEPLAVFHPAEAYHQNYVEKNPGNPYVQRYSLPKVKKLRDQFPDELRKD